MTNPPNPSGDVQVKLPERTRKKLDAIRATGLLTFDTYGKLVCEIVAKEYRNMVEAGHIQHYTGYGDTDLNA